jgi:hypothetical protein
MARLNLSGALIRTGSSVYTVCTEQESGENGIEIAVGTIISPHCEEEFLHPVFPAGFDARDDLSDVCYDRRRNGTSPYPAATGGVLPNWR